MSLSAAALARIHTALSLAAFLAAFFVGCALHYKRIVKNDVAGYPDEWFPSVSATIGDWYPERNIFQLLIALNSGPRFALLLLSHAQQRRPVLLAVGIARTLACGGWVFVTSSDSHDWHDALMIAYIVLDLPWMWAAPGAAGHRARRWRVMIASAFWLSLVPMIYFFVQHKVHRIPGAYTRYAFFEWGLIFLDIAFDSTAALGFADSGLQIAISLPTSPAALANGAGNDMPSRKRANEYEEEDNATSVATVTKLVDYLPSTERSWSMREVRGEARAFASFLSDVYIAYIAWTLITALPTTLFYFSVWKLALAGPEFATLATLTPFFLGIPALRALVRRKPARAILGAACLLGLMQHARDSVVERLIGVMAGVACACVRLAVEWDGAKSGYHWLVFVLGLILSSLSKHLNDSNNPLWPIVDARSGALHAILLPLGLLALTEQFARARPLDLPARPSPLTGTRSAEPWLASSLALGSLLYGLHERLADAGALPAWAWTGFGSDSGRAPHPHAAAPTVLLAQAMGVVAALALSAYYVEVPGFAEQGALEKVEGTSEKAGVAGGKSEKPAAAIDVGKTGSTHIALTRARPNMIAHPVVYGAGLASAALLVCTDDWACYVGGLLHAFFMTAVAPQIIQQASAAAGARGAGRVFGTAWLVWIVFIFTGTFTVAYAFVPGAWSFREHTDLVLAAQMLLLAPSFSWRVLRPSAVSVVPAVPRLAPLPARSRAYTHALLAVVVSAAFLAPLARSPPAPRAPSTHVRSRLFRAGIWTVHFGMDNAGRDSQRAMRDLVDGLELDVVGLLETDLFRPVFGSRDLSRIMARELGYYVDIGPGPDKHTWGAVLLSKFPILESKHHLLPSPDGELAPAIEAVLDIYGVNVTTIVAHNGQEETPKDRELQAYALADIMSASPYPVLFLGYVVTKPHAWRPAPYDIMVTDGRVHDIDAEDHDRWCEYIFYRGLFRTAYARVSRGSVTDTELQVGQFAVPRVGANVSVEADAHEMRYLRAWKEDMHEDHWLPEQYYGDGVDGHRYHVFNTPLYYKLPPSAQV